jgi:hypothetical protein
MTENEVQDRVYWKMQMQETIGTFMLGVSVLCWSFNEEIRGT